MRDWLQLQKPSLLLKRPGRAGAGRKEKQLQPWEQLFVRSRTPLDSSQRQQQGLEFQDFCKEVNALKFTWPTTLNTGQAPLNIRIVPGRKVCVHTPLQNEFHGALKLTCIFICCVVQSQMRRSYGYAGACAVNLGRTQKARSSSHGEGSTNTWRGFQSAAMP